MIELRMRLFVSLLVLLAAAPQASPQTSPSSPPASKAVVRKTGKAWNSVAQASPELCFQPGVGWQRNFPGQSNGSAARDARGPAGGANPTSADVTVLSAKQANSAECPGILTDKKEVGAGVEPFATLNPSPAIQSAGSAKSGALPSTQVTPALHPTGRAGLNSTAMTPSAMPSAPTYFAAEAGPDKHSDQIGERTFHAYISSIKLRRLLRNAPDFRTRMKLQQLENNQASKLHQARVDTKIGEAASKPLKDERVRPQRQRRNNGRPQVSP